MKLEFSGQTFEKSSDIKFHENPFSGSRVPCIRTETDMTKLIVTFRSFTNSPEKKKRIGCMFGVFLKLYTWEYQFINSVGFNTILCLVRKQLLNSKYIAILLQCHAFPLSEGFPRH